MATENQRWRITLRRGLGLVSPVMHAERRRYHCHWSSCQSPFTFLLCLEIRSGVTVQMCPNGAVRDASLTKSHVPTKREATLLHSPFTCPNRIPGTINGELASTPAPSMNASRRWKACLIESVTITRDLILTSSSSYSGTTSNTGCSNTGRGSGKSDI